MGQLFEEFVKGKDQWKSIAKKGYFRQLLTRAVTTEEDVPLEMVLDVLVAALESNFVAPPEVYEVLAARGKPAWLAAAGRKAATNPTKLKRMEAARWLQYGRTAGHVSKEDLDALQILLSDANEDVRSVATYPLSRMLADDPDQVMAHLKAWVDTLSPAQSMGIVACLAPAWSSNHNRDIFAMQEAVLAGPKHRFQFVVLMGQSLNRQPISLSAAEAGWDHLLAPSLGRLISREWKPAPAPDQDIALVRLMGKLLALRPATSIVRRAEEMIVRLLEASAKAFPPTEIIFGPQRELGDLASSVWPGYGEWWKKMAKLMSKPALKKKWPAEMKECEVGLRELVDAKVPTSIDINKLSTFQRSALEYSRQQTHSK